MGRQLSQRSFYRQFLFGFEHSSDCGDDNEICRCYEQAEKAYERECEARVQRWLERDELEEQKKEDKP